LPDSRQIPRSLGRGMAGSHGWHSRWP